jgi:hypothetical protein
MVNRTLDCSAGPSRREALAPLEAEGAAEENR